MGYVNATAEEISDFSKIGQGEPKEDNSILKTNASPTTNLIFKHVDIFKYFFFVIHERRAFASPSLGIRYIILSSFQ